MNLTQYGESSFFRETDPRDSLAATLPYARVLTDAGRRSGSSEVRHAAAVLSTAISSLTETLDRSFLHVDGSPTEVIRAFADDHQQPVTDGL